MCYLLYDDTCCMMELLQPVTQYLNAAAAAACLRTGRWLSCFGRGMKSREAQILEKLKVLDDIVSDSGGWTAAALPRPPMLWVIAMLFQMLQ